MTDPDPTAPQAPSYSLLEVGLILFLICGCLALLCGVGYVVLLMCAQAVEGSPHRFLTVVGFVFVGVLFLGLAGACQALRDIARNSWRRKNE